MTVNVLDLANKAAEQDTTPGAGGFKRELPRAGVAFLRFTRYLELGLHAPKDPTHKPQRRVRLEFDLLHPDHMIAGKREDGTDYAFPGRLVVNVNVGGPKSRFGKLFAKMNYDGSAQFMYQLLGKGFLGQIHHNKVDDKTTYVNLDLNGEWTIGAPTFVDPVSNVAQTIDIPPAESELQLFLYEKDGLDDADIKAMWDSIFIDTPADAEKSRNWIQETIMESINWADSRTRAAVEGGAALDTSVAATEATPAATSTDQTKVVADTNADADAAAQAALAALNLAS